MPLYCFIFLLSVNCYNCWCTKTCKQVRVFLWGRTANSHDAPWLTNSKNRNVFSLCWKRAKFVFCCRCSGKLFYTRGPAGLKLRSWIKKIQKLVLAKWTTKPAHVFYRLHTSYNTHLQNSTHFCVMLKRNGIVDMAVLLAEFNNGQTARRM